jgi:hypothetical protein
MGFRWSSLGLAILGCWILLSGCGYRYGQGSLPLKYRTICVPYVVGDKTGDLTAALIKEISRSGAFRYKKNNADLILEVAIIDYYLENVGFRYDRKRDDDLTHSMIPTETRVKILAETAVRDVRSGEIVLGPAKIYASVDFDHDYYFSRDAVNVFSLGQLTDYDAAHDAAQSPLNKALAQKIVDYVVLSW